jgi:hypothetical protein
MQRPGSTLLLAAFIAGAACLAADSPSSAEAQPQQCFRPEHFQSWRAPDARTIYIRVFRDRFFRLDLAAACPELLLPDTHLITPFDGTNQVCGALDWNITVSLNGGPAVRESCIVKRMTALSPAEVGAIPKRFKP